jgi:serine/threonine-protein kinase
MHQMDPSQGELSFELLAEIAVGATARIELCRVVAGRRHGELVVVKRLHPHIAEDPQFVDMFRDEVWLTAALKHPQVVEVVGWGQDQLGPWFAVEFVRGVSLQRLMKTVFETGERFTERMVVYLARSLCDGLAAAHGLRSAEGEHLNLVHRDLTPGNVLVGFDGNVKITDFGLAKAKQRLTKTLTGLLKGSPQYMSPEQVRGEPLDARSDIFALGVLLFELFTGRRPWSATTDLDAMRAITDEPPADMLALRPRMDKALAEVVTRCLEKKPSNRFQSSRELSDRFQEWLTAHGYRGDNQLTLARFVRRNAMRQMRWFERAVAGEFIEEALQNQQLNAPQAPTSSPGAPERTVPRPLAAAPTLGREERTAADAPRPRLEVPPPRAEAPTRVTADALEDEDEIDWGDEGPTLVQRSEQTLEAIEQARKRSRQKLPSIDNTTRRRRAKAAVAAPVRPSRPRTRSGTLVDEDSVELPTDPKLRDHARPARRAPGRPPPSEDESEADETIELREAGQRARALLDDMHNPGVVAPHDPDVPPLPDDPRTGVAATYATRPLTLEEAHAATEGDPSARPRPPLRPASSPAALYEEESAEVPLLPKNLLPGAMPAPDYPSELSLPGMPASTDFGAEARRMAEAAQKAADRARRAGEFAEATARVAGLAAEAALLAAVGERHRALMQLQEAQRLDATLMRGEIPATGPIVLDGELVDQARTLRARRRELLARHLRTREGITIAVLVVIAASLLVLLAVVALW